MLNRLTERLPGFLPKKSLRAWVEATRLIGDAVAKILQQVNLLATRDQSSRQHDEVLHGLSALSAKLDCQFFAREHQTAQLLSAARLNATAARIAADASEPFRNIGGQLSEVERVAAEILNQQDSLMKQSVALQQVVAGLQEEQNLTVKATGVSAERRARHEIYRLLSLASRAKLRANPAMAFELREEAELILMGILSGHLTHCSMIDVGANNGMFSEFFFSLDFEVYAFEPNPALFEDLCLLAQGNRNYSVFNQAISNTSGTILLRRLISEQLDDVQSSLYSSTTSHRLPEGWRFDEGIAVSTTTLAKAHLNGMLPEEVGILKIDVEGGELEVVQGIDRARYDFIIIEIWQDGHVFADSDTVHRTRAALDILKGLGYREAVAIIRKNGSVFAEPVVDFEAAEKSSWGNVILVKDDALFRQVRVAVQRIFGRDLSQAKTEV